MVNPGTLLITMKILFKSNRIETGTFFGLSLYICVYFFLWFVVVCPASRMVGMGSRMVSELRNDPVLLHSHTWYIEQQITS